MFEFFVGQVDFGGAWFWIGGFWEISFDEEWVRIPLLSLSLCFFFSKSKVQSFR
jgi:hypothetical protein